MGKLHYSSFFKALCIYYVKLYKEIELGFFQWHKRRNWGLNLQWNVGSGGEKKQFGFIVTMDTREKWALLFNSIFGKCQHLRYFFKGEETCHANSLIFWSDSLKCKRKIRYITDNFTVKSHILRVSPLWLRLEEKHPVIFV